MFPCAAISAALSISSTAEIDDGYVVDNRARSSSMRAEVALPLPGPDEINNPLLLGLGSDIGGGRDLRDADKGAPPIASTIDA